MDIQIAICDNDTKDCLVLEHIVREIMDVLPFSYTIINFYSGEALLLSKITFDLIFLDIIMEEKSGLEIGRQLYRKHTPAKIIFQTHYGEYCIEAMNCTHAFAFLEKPIQKDEVEEQINEYIKYSANNHEIQIEIANVRHEKDGKIIKEKELSIPANDILYFEYLKMQREIRIVTNTQEFFYSDAMYKLENMIKPLGFEICCRGVLVNLRKIKIINGYTITLNNGEILRLSQRRVTKFKERLNEYIHEAL